MIMENVFTSRFSRLRGANVISRNNGSVIVVARALYRI